MNLVIVNENTKVINSLNIDIIKTLTGEFDVEDLKVELINFYFNKVIIDITAIKNYFISSELFNMLNYFGKDKVILLLNDNDYCNDSKFLSNLIQNGFYNFTKNAQGVGFLVNRSNTYEDVKKYVQENTFSSALTENQNIGINEQITVNNNHVPTTNINSNNQTHPRIIGIQNLSANAGATTLMQQMVKQLSLNYNVKGIEINGHDSIYFRNSNILYCIDMVEAKNIINTNLKDIEIIVIDLNQCDDNDKICNEIIYLLEPGIIRLSKTIKNTSNFMEKIKDKKIVLNRSALKDEEINYFESQTGINVFYNLINFDDRIKRLLSVDKLLITLGYNKQEVK